MIPLGTLLAANQAHIVQIAADRLTGETRHQSEPALPAHEQRVAHTDPPANSARQTARNVDIDRETRTVVFQTLDEQTGVVLNQYPSEAQINLRAYLGAERAEQGVPASVELEI